MECQTCKSVNDASSRFCKECGSKLTAAVQSPAAEESTAVKAPETPPLSPEIAEKRRARVAELLPRAFAFAEKGALAEAIATAEEAAGLVPTSTAAHALLANLYEKSGQMTRAIESMKKVVALTPDAAEEKTRLEELQRAAAHRAIAPREDENKPLSPFAYWMPRIGAALAGALVVGIGISILMRPEEAKFGKGKKNSGNPVMMVGDRNSNPAFAGMPMVQSQKPARPVFIPAPMGSDVDPFISKGFAPTPVPRRADSSSSPRRQLPRALPQPESEPASAPAPALVPPVNVTLTGTPTGGSENISAQPPTERISVGPPSARQEKPADEGFIKIETHPNTSSPDKPEKAPEKPETGDAAQQARSLQGAGRYRDAVGRYQVALAASEAPAELHQNLGLCYQRLGDAGAARDSYSRAIDAYQAQLRRGREVESARRGIASCQAALEILRG